MQENNNLKIYNSLSRKKEKFEAINPPFVGMYVCGPTVYSEAHLGHARPAIVFDVLFRYLKTLGYKTRYVRNITDVGHLENDADEGEDKIQKKAKIEQLEPMEVVQTYTLSFHKNLEQLNCLPPSIEPKASGHILEQIEYIKQIIENGYGYEKNGSVYFDVEKYDKDYDYGKLSGRKLDELINNTRALAGTGEKRQQADFALWKKADASHIMRWNSPWSEGFPGWHLECSVMSEKYLGKKFDIHGGGLDLKFPHHECEISQSVAANGEDAVQYWIHNNLITINGQKMGKSLGNFILLDELFSGKHKLLEQAYSPMTIRFFILQAHYRGTLDFSNEALKAAEKGFGKLMSAFKLFEQIKTTEKTSIDISQLEQKLYSAMNDDLNTPITIAILFDGIKQLNKIKRGEQQITKIDLLKLKNIYNKFVFEILGLKAETEENSDKLNDLINLIIEMRQDAKKNKDFIIADKIRDELTKLGITIKDTATGVEYEINL